MPPHFSAIPGAQGFQQSNPSMLATASLIGSLQVFHEAGGIQPLRERSLRLTGYLEELLRKSKWWIPAEVVGKAEAQDDQTAGEQALGFTVITPSNPTSRGSQLSLMFSPLGGVTMPKVLKGLEKRGVVGDSRRPDVIRLAPCALYNTFGDVERAAAMLDEVMASIQESEY